MKDFSVEVKIEAPIQLHCGKDDTKSVAKQQQSTAVGLQSVILSGAEVEGVFAEHEQGALASAAESFGDDLARVELPSEFAARKKFIAEWASRAKKKRLREVAHLAFCYFLLLLAAVVVL